MTTDQPLAIQLLALAHRAVVAIIVVTLCAIPFLMVFGTNVKAVAGDYGAILVLASPVFAVLLYVTASFIEQARHRRFVIAVAVLSLVYVPVGTLLGIVTLMVIRRLDVRAAFDGGKATAASC